MIGELPKGQSPKVARFEGKIVAYTQDTPEEGHGFLLHPDSAVELATRLLAAVADLADAEGRAGFAHDVEGMKFQVAHSSDRVEGLVTFELNRAPLRGTITETQIAELAAGFTAACKWIDKRPASPRGNI